MRRQHRLLGVDHEVEQHLLQLVRVGEHLGQAGRQRLDDGDVGDALLVRPERQRLAHDVVDVHHRARRVPLAREREQVPDDARRAFGFREDDVEAAPRLIVRLAVRQPLGPGEDGGERVVQLVRDARDRLAERGELLGLQQLVVEVARLVVELLAVADVADQGVEPDAPVRERFGMAGDLDPDRREIDAPHAHQEVRDRAVVPEAREQAGPRLRIDEARGCERREIALGGLQRVPEDQPELRVGGQRALAGVGEDPGEGAHLDPIEQPGERLVAGVGGKAGGIIGRASVGSRQWRCLSRPAAASGARSRSGRRAPGRSRRRRSGRGRCPCRPPWW